MTQIKRQDPFARLRDNPQEPLDLIPRVKPKARRSRAWDKQHPVISYFIPEPLHVQAKDVRADILGLAHQHMTTITSVANALVGFSISHVRQGKLSISAVPDSTRRKMRLSWEESKDNTVRKIEIPRPKLSEQTALKKTKSLYLGYRWGIDLDKQIRALAEGISVGEVVLFLLNYGLDAYKDGRLKFKEETITVAQKVSPSW